MDNSSLFYEEKTKALTNIFNSIQIYNKLFINSNFMFISRYKKDSFSFFETSFSKSNFLHLTGIITHSNKLDSLEFYSLCLNRVFRIEDFDLKEDGTTQKKISILPKAMEIYKYAKSVGNYNNRRPKFKTVKIIGDFSCCMGFYKNNDEMFYPNSILNSNIFNEAVEQEQIVATLVKRKNEKLYSKLCYVVKKENFESFNFQDEIKNKISNVTTYLYPYE